VSRPSSTFGDFRCAHCGAFVTSAHFFSGVNNRNHCPYCLWSVHLDLFAAGDRLSACKAPMKPVGLTTKRTRNKYAPDGGGELMLVHECTDCRSFSINRIAADDLADAILEVYHESLDCRQSLDGDEIAILQEEEQQKVYSQLFGRGVHIRA